MQRIQKILSERGIASRRAAEKMIASGRVTVNGVTAQTGQAVDGARDVIRIDGKKIPAAPKPVYLMLHKPRGVMTTMSDDKGRATVMDFIDGIDERVVPVGRLDYDSEGLLIMTNDGELVHALTHPSREVDKVYRVRVKGDVTAGVNKLNRPVVLDGKRLPAPEIEVTEHLDDRGTLMMTIHTGVNRQVRRMCELAGLRVQRLRRVAVGPLALGDLKPGAWRYLSSEEFNELRKIL